MYMLKWRTCAIEDNILALFNSFVRERPPHSIAETLTHNATSLDEKLFQHVRTTLQKKTVQQQFAYIDKYKISDAHVSTDRKCAVCFQNMQPLKTTLLGCGHKFCTDCINTWAAEHDCCPLCRAPLRFAQCAALLQSCKHDFMDAWRVRNLRYQTLRCLFALCDAPQSQKHLFPSTMESFYTSLTFTFPLVVQHAVGATVCCTFNNKKLMFDGSRVYVYENDVIVLAPFLQLVYLHQAHDLGQWCELKLNMQHLLNYVAGV